MNIVSVAQFERETGIHISHLTGKMEKVRAISSYAGQNPSCMAMMQNDETVCSHCYAYKQVESVYRSCCRGFTHGLHRYVRTAYFGTAHCGIYAHHSDQGLFPGG